MYTRSSGPKKRGMADWWMPDHYVCIFEKTKIQPPVISIDIPQKISNGIGAVKDYFFPQSSSKKSCNEEIEKEVSIKDSSDAVNDVIDEIPNDDILNKPEDNEPIKVNEQPKSKPSIVFSPHPSVAKGRKSVNHFIPFWEALNKMTQHKDEPLNGVPAGLHTDGMFVVKNPNITSTKKVYSDHPSGESFFAFTAITMCLLYCFVI